MQQGVSNGDRRLPLSGVRVVDLTVVWSGPHATMFLADWGAEVIRLESTKTLVRGNRGNSAHPSREVTRIQKDWTSAFPNWDPGMRPWNTFPMFTSHARNKLSMTVDIRTPEGIEVLHDLVKISDVVIENNSPEHLNKKGITYESLLRHRPDLIMVRMPAYGLEGQYSAYRAFGPHMEGVSGHTWLWGYPDMDLSARGSTYVADAAAGIGGAIAVTMALAQRRKTGEGKFIELSQVENFVPYMGDVMMDYQMNRRVQGTTGNRHHSMAPHGCYRCKGDDHWVVMSVWSDEQWRRLCEAMGRPELAADPSFNTSLGRFRHQDELDEAIGAWTSQQDHTVLMNTLQKAGVPCGAVMDEKDLYQDPHMVDRRFFQKMAHPDAGTHMYPGLMWKSASYPNRFRTPPCTLGEHNQYAYRELLGIGDKRYARLEALGHIATEYDSSVP